MATINDKISPEMKELVDKVSKKVEEFNAKMTKDDPEGNSPVLNVLKSVEAKLESYKNKSE